MYTIHIFQALFYRLYRLTFTIVNNNSFTVYSNSYLCYSYTVRILKVDNHFAKNWIKMPIHSFQCIAYRKVKILGENDNISPLAEAWGQISNKKVSKLLE